jgi:hypothetical protein
MAEPVRRKRKASAKALAEKWGVCARTIRNYVAIPRAEYLANSLNQSKPWKALDMSRATWYRHGKPDSKSV